MFRSTTGQEKRRGKPGTVYQDFFLTVSLTMSKTLWKICKVNWFFICGSDEVFADQTQGVHISTVRNNKFMACVGKCVWGFITHYIIWTIVRWWVPHKTNSTYGMCKFACSKSYVEMNWWVFFSFAQCETSWMGETWMLKSPRTWHNSLLERLYWLVWIMCLIWFNICQ